MKNILKIAVVIAGLSVAIAAEAAQTPYPTLIFRTAPGVPFPAAGMTIQVNQGPNQPSACFATSGTNIVTMSPTQVAKCVQQSPTPNLFSFAVYVINADGSWAGGDCPGVQIKIPVNYSKSIVTVNQFLPTPIAGEYYPSSCTASTN